jgi:hypothetical protein
LNVWNRIGFERLEPFDFAQDRLREAVEQFERFEHIYPMKLKEPRMTGVCLRSVSHRV